MANQINLKNTDQSNHINADDGRDKRFIFKTTPTGCNI